MRKALELIEEVEEVEDGADELERRGRRGRGGDVVVKRIELIARLRRQDDRMGYPLPVVPSRLCRADRPSRACARELPRDGSAFSAS